MFTSKLFTFQRFQVGGFWLKSEESQLLEQFRKLQEDFIQLQQQVELGFNGDLMVVSWVLMGFNGGFNGGLMVV